MPGGPGVQHTPAALDRFAELVGRHDAGEAVDFERELAQPPELRAELAELHANWLRLRALLVTVRAGASELQAAEAQAGGSALQLDARSRRLLDLLARFRGSESRYELLGEIARGGMGVVLRVREKGVERELALKRMFRPEELAPELQPLRAQLLRRLLDEAWTLSRLDHPGIVQLHELGLDADGLVYFTMPLVRGRTLAEVFELVRDGREGWNLARALGCLLRVCEALAFAHSIGIVHRDLKPANVMVGRFGELQVMDWGLARSHGAPGLAAQHAGAAPGAAELDGDLGLTLGGDVLGTPAYMAPEQAFGHSAEVSPRADVYALGALLYELLAGQRPYQEHAHSTTTRALLERVKAGAPRAIEELAPDQPAELLAICRKAMQREPEERYPSMELLAEDLRASLEQRVVRAYEAGPWAEARKWVVRNRPLAGALASALLVLIAGLSVSLVFKARADRKAAEATQQRLDVLKLSAFRTLEDLTHEADGLWPADPAHVPACRSWMARAQELVAKLPGFRASLAELEQRSLPLTAEETGQRWWSDQMTKLVAALEAFADGQTGLMHGLAAPHGWGVERRLEFATGVEQRTLRGSDAQARWAEALEAIASSPKYGGLRLRPQLGLLPLGADPQSGLWEFAHLQSGEPAQRGADGQLILGEATGIVFVLLPGGTFRMGAQRSDPQGHNYDPQAAPNEAPVHEVTLSAFFLSKYELTQGQWLRFAGVNPSVYGPASPVAGAHPDLRHPVEQVSWSQCMELLARLGLELPTEAQWEYGARAGTETPWWTGAQRESLRGKVNLADRTAAQAGSSWPDIKDWPDLEDGWVVHAPAGSFPANPFGLHEVLGNVWEWCRDGWGPYSRAPSLDPLAPWNGVTNRVLRGGSYFNGAPNARSADRNSSTPDSQRNILGLRSARSLEP